jgi:hypothetical protein
VRPDRSSCSQQLVEKARRNHAPALLLLDVLSKLRGKP